MAKVQGRSREQGVVRSASELAAEVNRRQTSSGAPVAEGERIPVLIIESNELAPGVVCDAEVLSGGHGTGQIFKNIRCTTGALSKGDNTYMVTANGEQPRLLPIASTASAAGGGTTTINNYIATIWSAGTDVES